MTGRQVVALILLLGVLPALLYAGIRTASLWSIGRIGLYDGQWIEVAADPSQGFHWPYRLYIPASQSANQSARIWVRPNNTSVGPSDDFAVHHEDASKLLAVSRWQAERLKAVVLVPSFPRPQEENLVYTHSLDRDTVLREPPLGRLDVQLNAMIDHAREELERRQMSSCERVFIDGFSASGMFANRYALIHPQRVQAVAVGAPGGWPMVPITAHRGHRLNYPVGTYDFEEIFGQPMQKELVSQLPMFFYLGDEDQNDALLYRDAFESEQSAVVETLFGSSPVVRWPEAEKLYVGTQAKFRLYTGQGHRVSSSMRTDFHTFLGEHDDRSSCKSAGE